MIPFFLSLLRVKTYFLWTMLGVQEKECTLFCHRSTLCNRCAFLVGVSSQDKRVRRAGSMTKEPRWWTACDHVLARRDFFLLRANKEDRPFCLRSRLQRVIAILAQFCAFLRYVTSLYEEIVRSDCLKRKMWSEFRMLANRTNFLLFPFINYL